MYRLIILLFIFSFTSPGDRNDDDSWIRINQLGYTPEGKKVAVWCSKTDMKLGNWQLVNATTGRIEATGKAGKPFGAYGPFRQTCRLDFSTFKKSGTYYLLAGNTRSPQFRIGTNIYKGAADFCLRYMRQQRTGFNPFLQDSCHTQDGYVLYGAKAGIADSSKIDVVGGWHDASDYLQYATTSANATWHLLAAYRDFPSVFGDEKQVNGLNGKNGIADVIDEARWGLDWLLKMHPRDDQMFNQIADDRDHISMRIPKMDSQYGRGYQRPVYFVSGEPQQRGRFMNNTTGTSSTAAKFSSAFSLGSQVLGPLDRKYADTLFRKAQTSFLYAFNKTGVTQTASVRSPYIYAEDNWVDDMELAGVQLSIATKGNKAKQTGVGAAFNLNPLDAEHALQIAIKYSKEEKLTPWLGSDTAKHYQWYPFINPGHFELAKTLKGIQRDTIIEYYRRGINKVRSKARTNAFYRGIPYIWCSNNLVVAFTMQCFWYRQLTGDRTFNELEQANIDWLFGCNPWGTSMVYGLPSWGDTPVDPHSAFTHLKKFPIDGGLIDGPVYGSIYNNLIGIKLYEPDEYAAFQSDLAVYHDDYGDYSTNEPTMDGTASLVYLLAAKENESASAAVNKKFTYSHGGIIRGDSTRKNLALVFTGHEYADGGYFIQQALADQHTTANFFFTSQFLSDPKNEKLISQLAKEKHFIGNHSEGHLLYCDWNKRDSLLVTKDEFISDLSGPYELLSHISMRNQNPAGMTNSANFFLPPYEWYNDTIAAWCQEINKTLINFTPGTGSNADYTWPGLKNYKDSKMIYQSIIAFEKRMPAGLNGFLLLMHVGTDPKRTDKFYKLLPGLVKYLKAKGYHFQRVDQLLDLE